LERLRDHYDDEELVCPECGYEDEEGAWESETDGSVVEYYHECPSCGAVREHTIDLQEE
jgi:predicted RNA-binding Zn-ribbon protein involved in translation (DUF1610 family)